MGWQVDYAHSEIEATVRHMMISNVRGRFEKFTVDAQIDEKDVTKSTVDVKIDASSINTKMEQRDAHLKSPDFLDVDKYPYITFKSKQLIKLDDYHGKLVGYLAIKDVSRVVTLDVEFAGQARSPWGTVNAGFSAKTRVNRKDWNLNWNAALETGGWLVGEEVKIDIEIEFVQTPEPVSMPQPLEAVTA